MNALFFTAVGVNLFAFFIGNFFRWKKGMNANSTPQYNTMTTISTVALVLSLIAVVFLADKILIGIITAVLQFVIINPVVSGILMNIFKRV